MSRFAVLFAIGIGGIGSTGCTVVKPLVGVVAGPAIMLGRSNGSFCGCGDGRAVVAALAIAGAVGAVAGLVTGVISDVQALFSDVEDPAANWQDPFATNTSGSTSWSR